MARGDADEKFLCVDIYKISKWHPENLHNVWLKALEVMVLATIVITFVQMNIFLAIAIYL
jgi:hypothetical protein